MEESTYQFICILQIFSTTKQAHQTQTKCMSTSSPHFPKKNEKQHHNHNQHYLHCPLKGSSKPRRWRRGRERGLQWWRWWRLRTAACRIDPIGGHDPACTDRRESRGRRDPASRSSGGTHALRTSPFPTACAEPSSHWVPSAPNLLNIN